MSPDYTLSESSPLSHLPAGAGDDIVRLITENSRIVFWAAEPTGERILHVSSNYEEIYGRSCASLYADPDSWHELVHPEDAARVREEAWRPIEAHSFREIEYRILRPDGSIRWIVDRAYPVLDSEGKMVLAFGLAEDVTERKFVEVALQASEARLRVSEEKFSKAFRASPDAIVISSLADGRLLEVNDIFLQLSGFTREEAIGRTSLELGLWLNPKEREQMVALVKRDGEVRDLEIRFIMKSSQVRTILTSAHTIELNGTPCLIAIMRDITERKLLEGQLREAQKMEAVGRLAGGVAHDFNNLLVGMLGYSDLLLKKLPEGTASHRMASEINAAANRARDLTSRLLAMSRRQVLQPKVLDFNALVLQTERLLRPIISEDIHVHLRLDPKTGFLKADPAQLEQVILNLALNGRDAMPTGGTLSIETCNIQVDAAYARQHAGLLPGSYVRLWVADTGHGMSPEVMARIFEPFFTTKDSGNGSGLGLSTVYGIVKQSGGCITVMSEPGRGAAFAVYLPRVNEAPEIRPRVPLPSKPRAGTETVLLVEDERVVRTLVQEILEECGYRVLRASSGAEALRLNEETLEPIQLLITDVVMPEMSGPDLASRLSTLRPTMRVLYMSGYTDDEVLTRKGLPENSAFIQKPFTPDQFLCKVRETLDAMRRLEG
ncbi:MAG TPA: PAS domain S-box protein [Candidatus Sulfotelmatobacter sp.]|nr:PAS domain S-box protein [Candidatus Sulfotelmatobacter sp.]